MYIGTEVPNYVADQVMNLLKEGGNANADRDIDAEAWGDYTALPSTSYMQLTSANFSLEMELRSHRFR